MDFMGRFNLLLLSSGHADDYALYLYSNRNLWTELTIFKFALYSAKNLWTELTIFKFALDKLCMKVKEILTRKISMFCQHFLKLCMHFKAHCPSTVNFVKLWGGGVHK